MPTVSGGLQRKPRTPSAARSSEEKKTRGIASLRTQKTGYERLPTPQKMQVLNDHIDQFCLLAWADLTSKCGFQDLLHRHIKTVGKQTVVENKKSEPADDDICRSMAIVFEHYHTVKPLAEIVYERLSDMTVQTRSRLPVRALLNELDRREILHDACTVVLVFMWTATEDVLPLYCNLQHLYTAVAAASAIAGSSVVDWKSMQDKLGDAKFIRILRKHLLPLSDYHIRYTPTPAPKELEEHAPPTFMIERCGRVSVHVGDVCDKLLHDRFYTAGGENKTFRPPSILARDLHLKSHQDLLWICIWCEAAQPQHGAGQYVRQLLGFWIGTSSSSLRSASNTNVKGKLMLEDVDMKKQTGHLQIHHMALVTNLMLPQVVYRMFQDSFAAIRHDYQITQCMWPTDNVPPAYASALAQYAALFPLT
jgi:hypothetical protein